ncbi:alpha/beta hydrolase [Sorangium sp. So ce406]|uniref:alpha/beta hydrolase n=1 Tax=Sorangium sp. So ce406 TaxID=3133311 RepID=UPI003F5C1BC9
MPSQLIVPGYTGSGPRHWQTLWEQKLAPARRAEMPDWDHPDRRVGPSGHINTDAGFGPWPEGERILAALMGEPLSAPPRP